MKLQNNDLVMGASGRIGDMLVFRQQAGQTIIAKRPKKKNKPDTEDQLKNREVFTAASRYATGVVKDPARKAVYEPKTRPGVSAYNLAFADFFKAPEIQNISFPAYTGKVGDKLTIRAVDDFMVKSVKVTILNAELEVIESGEAILSENNVDWSYICKVVNANPSASMVRVEASDLPGNITQKEFRLNS